MANTDTAAFPPETLNVLDRHGGFTIEERMPSSLSTTDRFDMAAREQGSRRLAIGDSLWRPGAVLKKSTTGKLLAYDPRSFYQTNNDVTVAIYRVPGFRFPVLAWFDNATHERIA